ncbi:MAG: hypothetical protein Ct9H90mP5_04870 [Acidimicrobiaceae bacterium]|nr:MAG: hypothetical protein Ct9H90mP5_04870 [Acidimicrobiaceae bacterium]
MYSGYKASNEDIETAKEMLPEADGTDRELLRDEINQRK